MPILYSVVARSTTILAKYASCAGNFAEVTEQILAKITPENTKLTYSHSSYLFHYISEDKIIYLCITDDDFERAKAFLFLTDVKRKFQTQYGARARTALPFSMNSEFSRVMAAQMRHYSETIKEKDQVERVEQQVDELKGIMVRNIDQLSERGERLELLVDKTDDLSSHQMVPTYPIKRGLGREVLELRMKAVSFKKISRGLARSMWWKNVKLMVVIGIILIIILYFIISAACGGLDWPCTRS